MINLLTHHLQSHYLCPLPFLKLIIKFKEEEQKPSSVFLIFQSYFFFQIKLYRRFQSTYYGTNL
ncbi:hypothetical protein pb186bvf_016808 [Paramecium bursaria]